MILLLKNLVKDFQVTWLLQSGLPLDIRLFLTIDSVSVVRDLLYSTRSFCTYRYQCCHTSNCGTFDSVKVKVNVYLYSASS